MITDKIAVKKRRVRQSDKVKKNEVRAVIKYLCQKGISPREIHEDFMETLGKESPSYSTVKKWAVEFRRGRESTEDDKRTERPKEASTDESVEIGHSMVICDRRRNLLDIASEVGISFVEFS